MQPQPRSAHCSRCDQTKPIEAFGSRKDWCKPCRAQYNKEWRRNNADKHKQSRLEWNSNNRELRSEINRAWRYGFTVVQLRQFLIDNPDCALCGKPGQHIDHCHTTGQVRGHLCSNCNKGLGHFKDNVSTLAAAITYLSK